MTEQAKTLTTAQLAARLKMRPKQLRASLRNLGKGAKGKRYEFTDADVAKIRAAIKESKNEQQ